VLGGAGFDCPSAELTWTNIRRPAMMATIDARIIRLLIGLE
jgi:hypothetical protein